MPPWLAATAGSPSGGWACSNSLRQWTAKDVGIHTKAWRRADRWLAQVMPPEHDRNTVLALPLRLAPAGARELGHAAVEIDEMLSQLVEREAEGEDVLGVMG